MALQRRLLATVQPFYKAQCIQALPQVSSSLVGDGLNDHVGLTVCYWFGSTVTVSELAGFAMSCGNTLTATYTISNLLFKTTSQCLLTCIL